MTPSSPHHHHRPLILRSFTIATHPDVQQRIREELQAAGLLHTDTQPARELTYDDLARLSYLNCTIDETMRMYPVAATASVRCVGGGAGSLTVWCGGSYLHGG
jgi:hypothetical protein